MFDISFPELIVIGAIALIVLGPERLPTAARTTGLWIGKIKRTVSSVQQEITSQIEAEELQRSMKSQQDRFDQGLKKAQQDIEGLGDDPAGRSKKLSDSALGADQSTGDDTGRPSAAASSEAAAPSSKTAAPSPADDPAPAPPADRPAPEPTSADEKRTDRDHDTR